MDTVQLVVGSVCDRPWGTTLASLAQRKLCGELVVTADNKRCAIGLLDGAVIAATTSFVADSIARVALTSHLVTSTQVGEITKQLAASPDRDELDVVATIAHLSPEQSHQLRVRLVAQRAARTFAMDGGSFVVEDQLTLRPAPGSEVDMRAVIYQGARLFLSEQRLAEELRSFGTHFTLDPTAFDDVHAFGIADTEHAIIAALSAGASMAELEALHREIDPRTMQALVYALASFNALTAVHAPRTVTPSQPTAPRTTTPRTPLAARTQTLPYTGGATHTVTSDRVEMTAVSRALAPSRTATAQGLGARRAALRLPAIGRAPTGPGIARAPSESDVTAPRTVTSQEHRDLAQEAYRRGELMIRSQNLEAARSELSRACELSPSNVDYAALLAWVRFCLAAEKESVTADTRRTLEKAIHRGDKPIVASFYLGRVERMVGREAEALRRFREVLAQDPAHAEAASEVRILEARLVANAKR